MDDLLLSIETSALGQVMRDSVWLFPMAEILHFMGLSLLIGSLLVVDFRLLGFAAISRLPRCTASCRWPWPVSASTW